MLILVGVTINVALNGELFKKSSEAAKQTQLEIEREQLLSVVVGAMKTDGEVDFGILDSNLQEGWNGDNGEYTSPKGNLFYVDINGNISQHIFSEEYGFYFNTKYVCNNYNGDDDTNTYGAIFLTNSLILYGEEHGNHHHSGDGFYAKDFTGNIVGSVENLEFERWYEFTGALNSKYKCKVTDEGNTFICSIEIPNIKYAWEKVSSGDFLLINTFMNNGKSFIYNGKTFSISK